MNGSDVALNQGTESEYLPMGWLSRFLGRAVKVFYFAAGAMLIFLIFMTAANILVRRVSSESIRGTLEMTEITILVLVYLTLAGTERQRRHISVDIIYDRMRPLRKLIIGIFGSLVTLIVVGLLAVRLFVYANGMLASGTTTATLGWFLWPYVFIAAGGVLIFFLCVVESMMADIQRLAPSIRGGVNDES